MSKNTEFKEIGNPEGQLNHQGVKELKDLSTAEKLHMIGATGTRIYGGYIDEEYNRLFAGQKAFETYDEMYRSDSTVFKTILATQLPIQAGNWDVRPATSNEGESSEQDIEIRDFVYQNIFKHIDGGFDQWLFEILNFVRDGVSLFEKVYEVKDNQYWIKKLAVRLPRSVEKRQMESGCAGITQSLPVANHDGKTTVSIPDYKLLVFSFRKEGDNYAGLSMLRPIGKDWIIKKQLENYEVVGYEQQFKGVRTIRIPGTATKDDKQEYLDSVAEFRVSGDNTIVLPGEGYEFEFKNMDIKDAQNIAEAIKRHDARITDIMLGMFMKLGESSKGSYGMSENNLSFFLMGLYQVVKQISYVINHYLIKELVDMNYTGVTEYPYIHCGQLGDFDVDKISNALSRFSSSQLITPDPETEKWLREVMGMPAKKDTPQDAEDVEDVEEVDIDLDQTDSDLEDIESELEIGDFSSDEELFSFCEESFEFVDKIRSEAMKKARDKRGRKGKDKAIDIENSSRNASKALFQAKMKIKKQTEQVKMALSQAKNKVAMLKESMPKITAGMSKEQRQKIKDQRATISGEIASLRTRVKEYVGSVRSEIKALKSTSKTAREIKTVSKKELKTMKKNKEFHEPPCSCCTPGQQNDFNEYASLVDPIALMTFNDDLTNAELEQLKKKSQNSQGSYARPLTFAEQKVNLEGLSNKMSSLDDSFNAEFNSLLATEQEKMIQKIKKLVETNDVGALGKLGVSVGFANELAKIIIDTRKNAFDYGKDSAANEIGAKVLPTTVEQKAIMSVESKQIANRVANNIDNALTLAVTQAIARNGGTIKTLKPSDVMGEVKAGMMKVSDAAISNVRTLAVNGTINTGRGYITNANTEKIVSYQYSAILDDKTTDRCLSLDGRVVAAGSPDYFLYSPPQHYNCRSIWVAIMEDETFKPTITGIPKSITPVRDINNVQPLQSIKLLKDSPSMGILKQELDQRKALLEEYRKNDLYPNRQAQHEARIKQLEKSL